MLFRKRNDSRVFSVQKLIITALFVAIGVILPRLMPGPVFLPMHIPVLLAGILCGFPYGVIVGLVVPVISHFTTGMPPSAILPAMWCELAAYGMFTALFMRLPVKSFYMRVYIALYGAMLLGRVVYGVVNANIFNVGAYSMEMWLTASFVTALPGIVIQVVLIPPIVMAVRGSFRGLG